MSYLNDSCFNGKIRPKMLLKVNIGDLDVCVTAEPLSQQGFAPFGDVIVNVRPDMHPSSFTSTSVTPPSNAESANQGSAIKYRDVSNIRNLYSQSPSRRAEPKMSMFVSASRKLNTSATAPHGELKVRILERHPFTTQTFIPIASSASMYMVIVAPSLPPSPRDEGLPVPQEENLPGRGLPDLRGLKAFVATSAQAVTYGAGTWHAPMVVLGDSGTTLDFVVYQFASGEGIEDCQLVDYESSGVSEPRVVVRLPRPRPLEKL